jgi:glycerol-3-phosphate dehydrogenase (NAD+)
MKAATPPPYPVRVTVMGGGNFGIALATVCARNGIPTTLLVRSEDVATEINTKHRHPRYMSDVTLPSNIRATTRPESALSDATYIIHAVPCQYSRKFLEEVKNYIPSGTPILSASKGIETSSLGFMNDILRETLGEDRPYAFLSGPSFAREICEGVATAVVIASEDLMLASDLAMLLSDDSFRVFTTKDVVGVEIGGAVKNVIALAAGMCEGLGLGTNAMSGLVTRGCGEMRRLGMHFGAKPSTIAGLSGEWAGFASCVFGYLEERQNLTKSAGVGDTFGTCFGPLSRNRKFGYRLGKGETMEEIRASTTEVAEGVDTSIALVDLIKTKVKGYRLDLKYPILFGVASILEGNQTPKQGLEGLMRMPFIMENFDERFVNVE